MCTLNAQVCACAEFSVASPHNDKRLFELTGGFEVKVRSGLKLRLVLGL